MKKKTAPKKTTAPKTVKRTSPHSTSRASNANQTLVFRRIVIISACLVLCVGVMATFNRGATRQAVEGMSVMAGLYDQATVQLPALPNAVSYNIYYGQASQPNFTNAVRNISPNIRSYTISDLKKGVSYNYRYSAVDKNGKEFVFSPLQPLTNLKPE